MTSSPGRRGTNSTPLAALLDFLFYNNLFYITLRIHAMRVNILFSIAILMSTFAADAGAQTLPTPQAITDPKQITSKPNAQVEPRSLTIERLYMTRQIGSPRSEERRVGKECR